MKTAQKEQGRPSHGTGPARATKHSASDTNSPATAQPKPPAKVELIPLAEIGRSPWNRAEFSSDDMADLVASVRERGIVHPVHVRANPGYKIERDEKTGGFRVLSAEGTPASPWTSRQAAEGLQRDLNFPKWELIAGERRWRAAATCKLAGIPAIVRTADDRTALEEQALENLQRENLNPIHEAEKYHQLIELYRRSHGKNGDAIDEVSAKVQRSKSLIYERLKLLSLPEDAKDAALAGRLPASHAALITKIDDAAAQAEVTKRILKPDRHEIDDDASDGPLVSRLTIMSFRSAKFLVERTLRELEAARAYAKAAEEFAAAGHVILSAKECKKIAPHGYLDTKDYVAADDTAYQYGNGGRSWKSLLGKHAPPPILAKMPRDGEAKILYRQADIASALKKAGIKKRSSAPAARRKSPAELQREARHTERVATFERFAAAATEKLAQATERDFLAFLVTTEIGERHWSGPDPALTRALNAKSNSDPDLREAIARATTRQLRAAITAILLRDASPHLWAAEWSETATTISTATGVPLAPWNLQTSGKPAAAGKQEVKI